MRHLQTRQGRVFISSSKAHQTSHVLENEDISLFTKVVVDSLHGRSSDLDDEHIHVIDILSSVIKRVPRIALKNELEQDPVISSVDDLDPYFFLGTNPRYEDLQTNSATVIFSGENASEGNGEGEGSWEEPISSSSDESYLLNFRKRLAEVNQYPHRLTPEEIAQRIEQTILNITDEADREQIAERIEENRSVIEKSFDRIKGLFGF